MTRIVQLRTPQTFVFSSPSPGPRIVIITVTRRPGPLPWPGPLRGLSLPSQALTGPRRRRVRQISAGIPGRRDRRSHRAGPGSGPQAAARPLPLALGPSSLISPLLSLLQPLSSPRRSYLSSPLSLKRRITNRQPGPKAAVRPRIHGPRHRRAESGAPPRGFRLPGRAAAARAGMGPTSDASEAGPARTAARPQAGTARARCARLKRALAPRH